MRKTIRIESTDAHRIHNGCVEYLTDRCEWASTRYRVGARAVLVSTTDISPEAKRQGRSIPAYRLHWDVRGVPGNSNPRILRTTGWRGTNDNRYCEAHGVVTIRGIRELKSGDIAVTVA